MARRARKPSVPVKAAPGTRSPLPWIALGAIAVVVLAFYGWRALRPVRLGAVILISSDTVRADHLPVYGYTHGQTPVLDAFARDAVVFERAYTHAPQTLPSHSSILTGLLPFEHGVRDNLGFTLKPNTPTLASLFHTAGYRTGGFVSAYVLRKETGISQGFDVYNAEFPAGSQERSIAQVQRSGLDTLAATETWLNTLTDDKFFLFFHIYEPHTPYTPPPRYASLAPYDGEIAFADEITGRLLDDLKRRGWYDHAAVVLLSDHGEDLNEHGEEEHGLFLYDSTTHVPLMIKQPGSRHGGERSATPVQLIDIVPTIASIAGLAPPAGLRGRNLRPLLDGGGDIAAQGIYAEAFYSRYHFGWSELLSLTDDRYRFIKAPRSELYDLQKDPHETVSVIGDRAQVATAMRSGLDALIAGRGIDAPGAVSAEDRERLASLGYIGISASTAPGRAGVTLADPKDKTAVLQMYRTAVNAAGTGRLEEALAGFRKILSTDPDMVDVWNQTGTILARMGRDEDAFKAFQEVIRRQPNEPIALIDAATLLMKLHRFDEARQHAELAVNALPGGAHELLSKIALAKGDQPEALRQAALAEHADASLPMSDFVQGLIAHDKGNYAEALPHFMRANERITARTMQMPDLRYYIADCLARLDRAKEAEPYFQQEIEVYPNNLHARVGLAMLYEAESRDADAERVIAQMLSAVPSPESYAQGARLWELFGQPARAAAVKAESRAKFGKLP